MNNSLDDIQQLYGDLSADQSQISAALTDLQNKIASLNAIITETEVGTAFTVGSQIIRIPAVWSWNPVLGCALLVCAIVCDSMQIAVEVGLRDDVAGLVKAVQGLTDAQTADGQAIASLNSAGQQLQLLLSQVKALSDQGGPLTQIRDTLASLAMDSQESVSSILAAQNEQQIASLISDLQSAEAAWNEAASVAQNFQENLTIEVNTATMLVYHDGKVDEVPA
ncbi:hypothetical protein D3093_33850 (plasmid) [Azospirillum argentinense]|uniref:Uncharacterized protein n=1 Tax=Azospirillum argentinense TaxID=2970906 RepID=A0A4D8PSB6_9PROT|nr:hypothetical protein D3093_33850 [Azospirillum argentinense]